MPVASRTFVDRVGFGVTLRAVPAVAPPRSTFYALVQRSPASAIHIETFVVFVVG